jgi:hypothetical protein
MDKAVEHRQAVEALQSVHRKERAKLQFSTVAMRLRVQAQVLLPSIPHARRVPYPCLGLR